MSFKSSLEAGCCEFRGTRQVHSILIQCTSAQSDLIVPAAPVAQAETGKAARHKEQGKAAAVAKCFLSVRVLSVFLLFPLPERWSYWMPYPTLSLCTSSELLSPVGHSPKTPPCLPGLKAVLPTAKFLQMAACRRLGQQDSNADQNQKTQVFTPRQCFAETFTGPVLPQHCSLSAVCNTTDCGDTAVA